MFKKGPHLCAVKKGNGRPHFVLFVFVVAVSILLFYGHNGVELIRISSKTRTSFFRCFTHELMGRRIKAGNHA